MDRNRLWIIGSVFVMVVVVALGWFLGIQPQLANAASAEIQRAQVQSLNLTQEATLAKLKKDYAAIGTLDDQLADLSQSVPSGDDSPAFVDEVDAVAAAAGVTVTQVAIADAKPYAPVTPPAQAGGGSTPAPSASATPAPTTTPVPVATKVPGMPPVTSPKLTSTNFSSLAVTLTVKGTYAQALGFVQGLQEGKRLFLVDGITTSSTGSSGSGTSTAAPAAGAGDSATITGLIFVVTPPIPGTATAQK